MSHIIFHTRPFTHPLSRPTLSHTIFHTALCHPPSLTHHLSHHFVTHYLSHTTLSHTIFHTQPLTHHLSHTTFDTPSFTHRHRPIFHTPLCQLCHTPSFTTPSFTHHFVTHHLSPHHLSHTTLSHTIFHTQLCHTPSFTHNFVTRSLSHTTFTHNFVTHTIFPIQLCHTHNFVLLLDPPPPPLSFLSSPSPLQHLVLIIGRSCLVGLSGPLIFITATNDSTYIARNHFVHHSQGHVQSHFKQSNRNISRPQGVSVTVIRTMPPSSSRCLAATRATCKERVMQRNMPKHASRWMSPSATPAT